MKTIAKSIIAVAALGAVSSVNAVSFDFYKLGMPNGAGDFLPTNGFSNASDMVGSPNLTYTKDGLSVTASATANGQMAYAVQDSTAGYSELKGAGLGVYKTIKPIKTYDDNIDKGETLILTFDKMVNLTSLDLRADKHGVQNWIDGATFLLNGVSFDLPKGVGSIALNLVGTVFEFTHSGGVSDPLHGTPSEDFYVAGLNANVYTPPSSVPDSGATLGLLGLGMLGLAGVSRRLKK